MWRRRYLGLVGSSAVGMLAGCNSARTATDARPRTGTDVPSAATADATVFDGGGTAAFRETLRAADRAGTDVVVEPGTYRFEEALSTGGGGAQPHLELEGVSDVTVAGNGATLVFANPSLAGLRFRGGRNITLRDLRLDYDPVPFTQGAIVGLADGGRTIDVELDAEFPQLDHGMFARADGFYTLLHRSDGSFIRGVRKRGNWDHHIASATRVGDRRWRLSLTEHSSTEGLAEDRRVTVLARNNETALAFYKTANPTLSNVIVHAANGAAFSTGVCANPLYRDCGVHAPTDSDRQIGANADGIRVINCLESVHVSGCRHEALGDDSLVIQHTMTGVTGVVDDRTVRVANWHPFVATDGDIMDALSPAGVDKGRLPPIEATVDRFPTDGTRGKPARITFAEPIDDRLDEGDFVRNRATGSQNFTVRNNTFRNHRANLVRIAASHGVIEHNTLEGCSISPIELETDTSGHFSPKGWVRDVTVRNNAISRAGLNYLVGMNPAGVHVHHRPAPDIETAGQPNRGLTIAGNTIERCAARGIDVAAARDVTVAENTMAALNQLDYGNASGYGVGITSSSGIEVRANTVEGSSDHLDGFGWTRDSTDVSASGNTLVVDGESQTGALTRWVPVTLRFDGTTSWADRDPDSEDTRPLALYCWTVELLGEDGTTVSTLDIGGAERRFMIEGGVYDPSTIDGETGRWFGTESPTVTLYVPAELLAGATRARLRGIPMSESITMTALVDGERTDALTFGTTAPGWFTVALT